MRKDVGCWLEAKRNGGVQIWRRTRQSRGRGPPLFSSQRWDIQAVYHFSSFFWSTRGAVQQEGPGRLTKSTGRKVHTLVCSGSHCCSFFAPRGCAFLLHPTTRLDL